MSTRAIMWDVESAPLSDDKLELVKPVFEAAKNLKDPEKIKASIAEKEQDWRARAALDATTAQILAVGILDGNTFTVLSGDEKLILNQFWTYADEQLGVGNMLVGFCIFHFDLPMLFRRSVINGVSVPMSVKRSSYRPFHENFQDVALLWQCGNREQTISLDLLARSLGIGSKTGTGDKFARLWVEDRAAALLYLKRDLELTKEIYERMTL